MLFSVRLVIRLAMVVTMVLSGIGNVDFRQCQILIVENTYDLQLRISCLKRDTSIGKSNAQYDHTPSRMFLNERPWFKL